MSVTSTSGVSSPSGASGSVRGGRGRLGRTVSGLAVALGCVLFLGGFGWGAVTYRPYTVPTDSMRPTVNPGDKVLAQKVSGSDVHRGDVVVFKDALWGDLPEVKRVVGIGGDTVACCDKQGRMTVDGKPVDEPYLRGSGPASLTSFSTKVPEGELFLVGDNRAVSLDSRVHLQDSQQGSVPVGDVRARVDATAWPLGRVGRLSRTSAFDGLPEGGASPSGPLGWILAMIVAGTVLIFGGAAHGPVTALFERRGSR